MIRIKMEPAVVEVDGSQIYPDLAEPLPRAHAHAMEKDPPGKYLAQFVGPGELLRKKSARKLNPGRCFLDKPFMPQEILQSAEEASQDRALSALDAAIIKGIVVAVFTPNGHASYLSNLRIALVEVDNQSCQIQRIDRKVIKSQLNSSPRHFPS